MRSIAVKLKAHILYIFIVLLTGSMSVCFALGFPLPVMIALEIAGGIMLLYGLFFRKKLFYFTLVCLIPLSVPLRMGGASISLPSEFMVFMLGIFVIGRSFTGTRIDRNFLFHPITIILCLDLIWMLICSFYSTIPLFSYKRTFIRLLYLAVFYFFAAELFSNKKNIIYAFLIYAAGMLLPVISSVLFHARYNFTPGASYKMTVPFFNDHTIYGAVLAFLIPMVVYIAATEKKHLVSRVPKFWLWMLAAILIVAFLLSFSRAAWLSMLISLAFAVILYFRIRFHIVLVALGLLTGLIWLNSDNIIDAARRNDSKSNARELSEHVTSVSNIQTDASNTERFNRWKCAVRMFRDRPVTGFGPGTYQFVYGIYQVRSEMTRISTVTGNRGHAHSEYLTYLSEMGLPGFLIFLAQVFVSVFIGMKIIYNSRDRFLRRLTTALLLALITLYIHSFFNAFMDIDKMAMLAFTALAGIVVLHNLYKNELAEHDGELENEIKPQQ